MQYAKAFLPLLIIALAAACTPPAPVFKANDISTVPWGGDFELSAHSGGRMKSSDLQGKVVVIFFGFTHCPDICSPTLMRLAGVIRQLDESAKDLQVLFVTVDPEHDTPEQLAGFVPKFHPSFIGLTGSVQEIEAVKREFKVAADRRQGGGAQSTIDHTGGVFIKDRRGKLRLYVRQGTTVEDMLHDVRLLLAERA